MADAHFFFRGRFAEGGMKRFVEEYGIVAEAVGAAWFFGDAALYYASESLNEFTIMRKRDYAYETGCSIFDAAQLF